MTEEVAAVAKVDEPTTAEPKTDAPVEAAEASEETIKAISERLAFFFSDANLRQDKFMRKFLMGESAAVPVECMLRFNTIKKHTAAKDDVVKAAETLPQLKLSEKGIGRTDPFTSEKMDENIPLTLCLNNIPYTKDKYDVSTDDIRKLFPDEGRGIALCKLRFGSETVNGKHCHRVPKGIAMVEFETLELYEAAAKELMGDPAAKELKLGEAVLTVSTLRAFVDSKKEENRKLIEENAKQKPTSGEKKRELTPIKQYECNWSPGCVIKLTGLDCDREAMLEAVAKSLSCTVEQVKDRQIYVDYSRGQADGAIRFKEPTDDVKLLCDKLSSGDVTIAEKKVAEAKVLSGEDEKDYWDKFIAFKNKQIAGDRRKKSRRN